MKYHNFSLKCYQKVITERFKSSFMASKEVKVSKGRIKSLVTVKTINALYSIPTKRINTNNTNKKILKFLFSLC